MFLAFSSVLSPAAHGRTKEKLSYGEGVIINLPLPEAEVLQVVEDIAQNGIIRGTKEYNKDQFVMGAVAAESSTVFPAWTEGGKVIYKVRAHALDPVNFQDSSDVGTLVVRYIVLPQGDKNTVLHIDALFQEDFRQVIHKSNGLVESSEYKDIREHLDSIEVMKQQTVEAESERQDRLNRKQGAARTVGSSSSRENQENGVLKDEAISTPTAALDATDSQGRMAADVATSSTSAPSEGTSNSAPAQSLEQQVKDLRRQVQRLVRAPGAPLKSAPYHTANTLQLLNPGIEVLIVISTPYWYGVETHEGQHGWMQRDQLEEP